MLATIGILVLNPIIYGIRLTSGNPISEDLSTTIAAQIMTLPVILSAFGQYLLTSIFANILVLWTIPLIMTIGGVGIVAGLVFEPLGKIIVVLIIPLLWYMQQVTSFFSTHAILVQVQNVPTLMIFGYYLLILSMFLIARNSMLYKGK